MNNKTTFSLLSLVLVVLAAGAFFAFGQGSGEGVCSSKHVRTYTVTVQDNRAPLTNVYGKLCDKLTFTNNDHVTREIAFGAHDDHVPYDDVAEKILNQNQSFTITLNQTGTFHWHDHNHDEVGGYFTVMK